jgi:exodeoxyribonuclease V gamma subunit
MAGLFVYYSNDLEKLSWRLAELMAAPSESPLSPELVVVHSKGMGQWLAMALAKRNGICANTTFPFPNAFLNRLLDAACPEPFKVSPWDPEVLSLRVMRILMDSLQDKGFEDIHRYMGGHDPLKLFGLSEKIAGLFDQYLIFRPDMTRRWEKGEESHWQAELWRRLCSETSAKHRAARREIFFEKIITHPECFAAVPPGVYLFGISYLPVFHLEALAALSNIRDIHLFSMNPCCEYWGDVVSSGERKRWVPGHDSGGVSQEHLYLETGNPLLSSLGRMGRDFFNLILGMEAQTVELFEEIPEKSILGSIQADILHMTNRVYRRGFSNEPDPMDASLLIHSCHSRLREIEVLQDQLLSMFEADPRLGPGDIFVMAPDMEPYAPFVQAVFGGQAVERMKIPFHIPDQTRQIQSPVIRGFLCLLELAESRFTVSEIMKILDIPGVKEKFGLTEPDLAVIEKWVQDTGIRWGIDASHRTSLGLPGLEENTWRAGFKRLLLGYAMPGKDRRIFSGILPYDDVEGGDAEILGRFLNLFDALVRLRDELKHEKTLKDWAQYLKDVLERFFPEENDPEADRQFLREMFDDLDVSGELSGTEGKFELPVVRRMMDGRMEAAGSARSFISGSVTFCTLLPFRSIPAKVVCLLGMNGDAFPGNQYLPGFDLMAKHPRPGDRIKRNDDQYLFLQALMSARDRFYVSFVGQSNRDNTRIPPCVIVQELLAYVEKGFGVEEDRMVTRHRLQPFAEDYFLAPGPLFSYSADDFSACIASMDEQGKRKVNPAFIQDPLSPPDTEALSVEVRNLSFFFNNPSKYLLEKRLGIVLAENSLAMDEEEPFALDGLNRYALGQDLLRGLEEGDDLEHLEAVEQARGRLPHGSGAGPVFQEAGREALSFFEKIRGYEAGGVTERLPIRVNRGDFQVSGDMGPVVRGVHLHAVYAGLKPKYMVRAWVNHLILNALEDEKAPKTTLLICKDATLVFRPVEEGANLLDSLLGLYWQGLMAPLAFFPETSHAYAEAIVIRNKSEEEALAGAMGKWRGNDFSAAPESMDDYFRMCFPGKTFDQAVKNGEFQKTALEVFEPLLKAVNRER